MNTRVEPSRVGLALLTIFGLVVAMLMVFSGAPAIGQQGNPPAEECEGVTGLVGSWKIQINEGVPGVVETSGPIDDNDIDFDYDDNGTSDVSDDSYGWTNESDDGFVVYRVVEKEGHGGDVHNGVWLVGQGFDNEEVDSDISHITFCFGTATTTTAEEETTTTVEEETTTTVEEETTTTVEEETTTTVEDEVQGTVITTTTVADEVLDTEVEAEELPFTGVDSELLLGMAVLMLMSGLLVIGLTGRREDV
jgi:hypothetical protein